MVVPLLKNRAGVACTTTGTTSPITLGAALGSATAINQCSWQTFANAGVTNGQVVRYLILDSNGNWEYGTGTYTSAGTTLTRTVIASAIAGVTGTSLITLSASSQVFIASIGEDIVPFEYSTGKLFLGGTTTDLNLWAFPTTVQNVLLAPNQAAQVNHYFFNDENGPIIWFNKSRSGTPGSHAAVTNFPDQLGALQWAADDGTTYSNTVAGINVTVYGTPAAGDIRGLMEFQTAGPTPWLSGNYAPGTWLSIAWDAVRLSTQTFISRETSATNTVTPVLRVSSTSSGTSAIGIGVGLEFEVECATNTKVGGVINAQTTNVTNTTEAMTLNGQQMAAGALQDYFGVSFLFRSLNSSPSYSNVNTVQPWFPTAGAVTLEASSAYEFEGQLMQTNGTTSHTVGLSFTGTAAVTISYVTWFAPSLVNATITTGNTTQVNQTSNTVVTPAITTAGTVIQIRGVVRVTTGGTFIPNFTFSAAPGAGTILTGTFFKLRKMGINTNTVQGPWA